MPLVQLTHVDQVNLIERGGRDPSPGVIGRTAGVWKFLGPRVWSSSVPTCECLAYAVFGHVGGDGDRPPGVAGFSGCSHGGVAVVDGLELGCDCSRDLVEWVGHGDNGTWLGN